MWRRPRGYLLLASDTLDGGPARISVDFSVFSSRTAVAVLYGTRFPTRNQNNTAHSNVDLQFPPQIVALHHHSEPDMLILTTMYKTGADPQSAKYWHVKLP